MGEKKGFLEEQTLGKGTWGMTEEQKETRNPTGEYFMSSFISLTQQKNNLSTTNNTHEFKSKKRG